MSETVFISKDELLQMLARKYGDLTDNCGCSVSTEHGWSWLSVANIVEIIGQCTEYT